MRREKNKRRRALIAINEKRVIRIIFHPSLLTLNVVKSSRRDAYYLLYPEQGFCTCTDFFFNNILRKKEYECYHLLAYKIANEKGLVREIKCSDEEFKRFFAKVIFGVLT
ncbi:MAG: hypothetical protein B6U94_01540 [Thermofilum sp. ex4484_79]|nr:MAG: hypothetical protein B6U94_01540 [Thermofilum sp. ex4484_79]